jgi:hypothetical protein
VAVVLSVGLFTNLSYISTALGGLNDWTGDLVFLRRDVPRLWNAPMARMDAELPREATPLLVGQAAPYHLQHRVVYNTVFNPETLEQLASGKSADAFRQALIDGKLTHIYVDWKEIQRHRQRGGYGFTPFVTPARFAAWVEAGVLAPPVAMGPDQELYAIRPPGRTLPSELHR